MNNVSPIILAAIYVLGGALTSIVVGTTGFYLRRLLQSKDQADQDRHSRLVEQIGGITRRMDLTESGISGHILVSDGRHDKVVGDVGNLKERVGRVESRLDLHEAIAAAGRAQATGRIGDAELT